MSTASQRPNRKTSELVRDVILGKIKNSTASGRARYTPVRLWASAEELSEATNVSVEDLVPFLRQDRDILEASNLRTQNDQPLFTARDQYKGHAGIAGRVISSLTGRVVG